MACDAHPAVKEAEVYAAYGRFAQAISVLEEAIAREPTHSELRAKLEEIRQQSKRAAAGRAPPASSAARAARSPGKTGAVPEYRRIDFDELRERANDLDDPAERAQALSELRVLEQREQHDEATLAKLRARAAYIPPYPRSFYFVGAVLLSALAYLAPTVLADNWLALSCAILLPVGAAAFALAFIRYPNRPFSRTRS